MSLPECSSCYCFADNTIDVFSLQYMIFSATVQNFELKVGDFVDSGVFSNGFLQFGLILVYLILGDQSILQQHQLQKIVLSICTISLFRQLHRLNSQ